MGYRYLNVRINSANDVCISCENFVKFGPVSPDLTKLICARLVRHVQKLAYFVEYLRIYWTNFAIFTLYDSALNKLTDDKSGPYFTIWQGTVPWQPYYFVIIK